MAQFRNKICIDCIVNKLKNFGYTVEKIDNTYDIFEITFKPRAPRGIAFINGKVTSNAHIAVNKIYLDFSRLIEIPGIDKVNTTRIIKLRKPVQGENEDE